jgi:hypothetical protein
MSKTPSLDSKTIYQSGIILVGLICIVIVGFASYQALNLFKQPQAEPVIKIREQQLSTAIKIVVP